MEFYWQQEYLARVFVLTSCSDERYRVDIEREPLNLAIATTSMAPLVRETSKITTDAVCQ